MIDWNTLSARRAQVNTDIDRLTALRDLAVAMDLDQVRALTRAAIASARPDFCAADPHMAEKDAFQVVQHLFDEDLLNREILSLEEERLKIEVSLLNRHVKEMAEAEQARKNAEASAKRKTAAAARRKASEPHRVSRA